MPAGLARELGRSPERMASRRRCRSSGSWSSLPPVRSRLNRR